MKEQHAIGPSRKVKSPWVTLILLAAVIGLTVAVILTSRDKPTTGGAGGSEPAAPVDPQVLVGRWVRDDGDKFINVEKVHPDGRVEAAYFQPAPKNVSKAEIRRDAGKLGLFVEIRDAGYPGATYTLTYDPKTRELAGQYYHPQLGQTFDVKFTKE